MNIGVVQIRLTVRAGSLPGIGVRIVVHLVATGENIIARRGVCIEALEGDRGIDRNASTGQKSRSASAIRDPVSVPASKGGHDVTSNVEAAWIPVWGNPCADQVTELGCRYDRPLGRRYSKYNANVVRLNDKLGIGEISCCIRRCGRIPW